MTIRMFFKLPFVDHVVWIDKRLTVEENRSKSVQVIDSRRYVVDLVTMYKKVSDSEKFLQSMQADFDNSDQNIRTQVDAALRETYGKRNYQSALSDERLEMMREIRDQVRVKTAPLGIDIVDVRIRRTDLPEDVLDQTLFAHAGRAQGGGRADPGGRQPAEHFDQGQGRPRLHGDHRRGAARLRRSPATRGEGERNRIFAEVFPKDPEFFAFYRSMKAYAAALKGAGTTYVLKPDSSSSAISIRVKPVRRRRNDRLDRYGSRDGAGHRRPFCAVVQGT